MAGDDSSSSDSPEQSPPLESSPSPPPPPPSNSSSSAPPPDSSSSSPPPPSDSDNIRDSSSYASPPPESSLKSSSSPPPPDSSSGLSSPPPPDSSSESSPSPPPPDSSSGSSPPSPPPPPSDKSQSSPPPPSKSNGSNNNNEGGSKSSPSPSVEVWTPPTIVTQPVIPAIPIGESQTAPLNGTLAPSDQGPPPSSSSPSFGSSNNNTTAIIVGIVGVGGILLLLLIVCLLCMRKKKKKEGAHMPPYGWETGPSPQATQESQDHAIKMPPTSDTWGHTSGNHDSGGPYSGPQMNSSLEPSPSLTLGFIKSTFTYEELASATNNFENSKMLGQGGFGYVHKGVLPNGKEIAVKSLKSGSGQGEREFAAEVEIISRVHHRHLVSLVGFCIARGQRMLVYEFVPNDTLEHHLHKKGDPVLDFSTRLRVALGSAKGLGYLHEDCHPRIIHRDIKASNILLDENFEAMVADFGLAKLTTDTNTHVSTRVMGTFGYLAPEYASSGKLTEKSDVFSFGVMLLELITGRRPVDPNMQYMEDSLVDWSRPLLTKALETGNYDELADPRLERNYNLQEMQRMVACAAASIRHSAKKRPKMSQIVRALEGDVSLEDLNNDGTRGLGGLSSSEGTSSDYDTRAYSADLKKFRQMAFATQDFASSEYGGTTSEYGLNPSSSSSDNSREINTKEFNSSKI